MTRARCRHRCQHRNNRKDGTEGEGPGGKPGPGNERHDRQPQQYERTNGEQRLRNRHQPTRDKVEVRQHHGRNHQGERGDGPGGVTP